MSIKKNAIYTPENIPLFEALYEKGLISFGGYPAVDRMFADQDLTGKHLLDVGSGLGGMAIYLAKKHDCYVTGLDIHPWMAEYASSQVEVKLLEQLEFVTYSADFTLPLPDGSFDLVYSKGVLTNVKEKDFLLGEISRTLKTHGEICFIDWLVPSDKAEKQITLPTGEASYKESQDGYTNILEDRGFKNIHFDDLTEEYLTYAEAHHERLSSPKHRAQYKEILDDSLRDIVLKANEDLIEKIRSGDQLSMRIQARKA